MPRFALPQRLSCTPAPSAGCRRGRSSPAGPRPAACAPGTGSCGAGDGGPWGEVSGRGAGRAAAAHHVCRPPLAAHRTPLQRAVLCQVVHLQGAVVGVGVQVAPGTGEGWGRGEEAGLRARWACEDTAVPPRSPLRPGSHSAITRYSLEAAVERLKLLHHCQGHGAGRRGRALPQPLLLGHRCIHLAQGRRGMEGQQLERRSEGRSWLAAAPSLIPRSPGGPSTHQAILLKVQALAQHHVLAVCGLLQGRGRSRDGGEAVRHERGTAGTAGTAAPCSPAVRRHATVPATPCPEHPPRG